MIQIRGDAGLVTESALEHRARATRVICRIRARRITFDAIHV